MKDINEVIADAIAEETTKTAPKEIKTESKVTIDLSEYVALKQKEHDLGILLTSFMRDLKLRYDKEGLSLNGEYNILDAFHILFPAAYNEIYNDLLEEEEEEGE